MYRGNEKGVSKVVRDAYQNYGDMEFGNKNLKTKVDDPSRHIKLISIAGKGVWCFNRGLSRSRMIAPYIIIFDSGVRADDLVYTCIVFHRLE